jgi:hypothetical protein
VSGAEHAPRAAAKRERKAARNLLFAAREPLTVHRTIIAVCVHDALRGVARGDRYPLAALRPDALRPGEGVTADAVVVAIDAARVGCSRAEVARARDHAVEMLRNGGVWWAS